MLAVPLHTTVEADIGNWTALQDDEYGPEFNRMAMYAVLYGGFARHCGPFTKCKRRPCYE